MGNLPLMENPVKIATGGKHDAEYLEPGEFNQEVGGINLATLIEMC